MRVFSDKRVLTALPQANTTTMQGGTGSQFATITDSTLKELVLADAKQKLARS
ncbi:hypothetical protein LTR36_004196 [Oleoguttula mirabilis]|uniref:Uncharacterized protein n=1 Tax=Oleoguttula mirabilis TaxID=1507867 RepID=A0AAV9JHD4_9PEZI|nr:hypothetical protein LTR36_004196 [Oleoguttula mirabilis]